jgi:hypothetical protein
LGKAIDASGHMRVWPVPKDAERGPETEAERRQRKAREQFMRPFLWEQFAASADKKTQESVALEAAYLVAEFGSKGEVPLKRAAVAIIEARMGDYDEINLITGALISSKAALDVYIKGLKGQSRRGRPPGRSNSRSYTEDNFWPEEAAARKKLLSRKSGKLRIKDIAAEMGIGEWQYYSYRREYPR